MHAGHIAHATRSLGAPKDWDSKRDGPCHTLVIRDELTAAGYGMTSAWFLTPEEIMRAVNGAPVYLTIIGTVHPPVCMSVGPTPD
jgi:hypothetical protein